jgi:DNA-binding CsgD family transcriptional regulator
MLTKTQHGYGLGSYEGIPTKLDSGRKITPTEARAAVCRINGLSQKEAAEQMHCSKSNVNQMWQSIFFKTNTSDALTAVVKLLELGVLKHLVLCLIIFSTGLSSISSTDAMRPPRPSSARTRTRRQESDIRDLA